MEVGQRTGGLYPEGWLFAEVQQFAGFLGRKRASRFQPRK